MIADIVPATLRGFGDLLVGMAFGTGEHVHNS
jgi:hypothetical protein